MDETLFMVASGVAGVSFAIAFAVWGRAQKVKMDARPASGGTAIPVRNREEEYVLDRQREMIEAQRLRLENMAKNDEALQALRENNAKWDAVLKDKIAYSEAQKAKRSPPYQPTKCEQCGKVMGGVGFIGSDLCRCDEKNRLSALNTRSSIPKKDIRPIILDD